MWQLFFVKVNVSKAKNDRYSTSILNEFQNVNSADYENALIIGPKMRKQSTSLHQLIKGRVPLANSLEFVYFLRA